MTVKRWLMLCDLDGKYSGGGKKLRGSDRASGIERRQAVQCMHA